MDQQKALEQARWMSGLSNCLQQSNQCVALAQMHKAGLTGLPQHCTREGCHWIL